MAIAAPARLNLDHLLDDFRCSHPSLTRWLIERARHNQQEGAANCFVVCAYDSLEVIGYYALAAGGVQHSIVPGRLRRNMPDPIPVALLGRLAVHDDYLGQGIGSGLLQDALLRTLRTAQDIGIRALICHAIDQAAKDFYLHHGFVQSPIESMTVMLGLSDMVRHLGAKDPTSPQK